MRSFLNRLQPRERRAVLGLGGALVLFALLQFAVFPIMDAAGKGRADLPLKEKTLHKYRRLVSLVGTAETDWKALDQRLANAENGLLDSKTAALASAEVQERVKTVFAQQGIELRGVSFLPVRPLPPEGSGYSTVPLSMSFECTVDQLASVMGALQASGKIFALETFAVQALPSPADKPRKVLSVRLVVRAMMRTEPEIAATTGQRG